LPAYNNIVDYLTELIRKNTRGAVETIGYVYRLAQKENTQRLVFCVE